MSHEVFLQAPALAALGIEHGFGTRHSRDVSVPGVVTVKQVHGTDVLEAPLVVEPASGDALWTAAPGIAVAVRTADCVPVLLVDQRRRGVAAVHAGWRGSAAGIAARAVAALCHGIGAEPSELRAAIGPHIGPCCYEVDGPVVGAIEEQDRDVLTPARAGHAYLSLLELNRRQLIRAGLTADSIACVPGCTSCDARFESYRRDRAAGRMLTYVRMRPQDLDTG
jgi:polyphenol oxidase